MYSEVSTTMNESGGGDFGGSGMVIDAKSVFWVKTNSKIIVKETYIFACRAKPKTALFLSSEMSILTADKMSPLF